MELSLNSEGEKKLQYIKYFMHRINLLRYHKITPVVVFDGGNIPCKAGTENERHRRRKANKEMAMEKLREGNVNAATELFQRAISITPSMAHVLIQTLKSENVEFVVAPYEADAQLAYLSSLGEEHNGIVAVISEDSDLLAYGCPSIIFKMDRFGNGEEIVLDKVFNSTESKPSFRNFTTNLFIDMCVLAGCDFLPSIPGIGISKAHALISKYRNSDRVLSVLKNDKGKQVPDYYARSFREAVAVFQHATIYNRKKKKLEHMKELSGELLESLGGELDFLGPDIPATIATAIAEGNLDPSTMEAYELSVGQQISGTAQSFEETKTERAAEDMIKNFKQKSCQMSELPKLVPTQSCFTVYSSSSIISSRKKVRKMSDTSTVMVERQVLKEKNFSDEAATLSRLVTTAEIRHNEENSTVSEVFPVTTPDNNPFRKRKLHSENTETTPTMKSSLTEDDHSELKSNNLNSQESVNSKNQKLDDIKDQGKAMSNGKTRNCKSSGNRNSILNFFARI
ncbi:hypothetical protein BVRB_5g111960 [Beta vulgaris subsp. vulgaris]|nr:hypothetical protein BVRB_5g111960 [Beta vulgaris subsp. vulgaris]